MTQVLSDSGPAGATRSGDIDRRLAGAWRREWQFILTRGLGRLAVWLAAMLAVDFILDWQIDLPGGLRMGLLGVNVAVLLGVLFWDALRHLKIYDPLRVALQVERLYPRLESLLVSYVQLHQNPEAHPGISPALVRAMCREAVLKVQTLDFGKIVRFSTLRKLLLVVVLSVGIEAAAAAWKPAFLQAFLARMTDPNSAAEYPTATVIVKVAPGDRAAKQGGNITLSVTVTGDLPDKATLYVKQDGSPREAIELVFDPKALPRAAAPASASAPAEPTRTFSFEIERAAKNFTYWFRAGDALGKKYRIEMVPPPAIDARVWPECPAYTKIKTPKEGVGTAGLDVLAGTKMTWKLKFNRPVDAVEMQGAPGGDVALKVSADGTEAVSQAPITAKEAFSYGFFVRDRAAARKASFDYPPDVSYSVSVHADREPTLTMIPTGEHFVGTVDKKVPLAFTAEDDYGLTTCRIIWWFPPAPGEGVSVKGGPQRKENVWTLKTYPKEPLQISEQVIWKVKEAIPALKPKDVVEYLVEVVDNRQVDGKPAGNVSRSREYRLEVLSIDDYQQRVADREKEYLEIIRILAEKERKAAEDTDRLNRQGAATTQPTTKP